MLVHQRVHGQYPAAPVAAGTGRPFAMWHRNYPGTQAGPPVLKDSSGISWNIHISMFIDDFPMNMPLTCTVYIIVYIYIICMYILRINKYIYIYIAYVFII